MFKNSLALEFYLYPLDFHIHLLLLLLLLSRFSRVLPCESPEMAAHPAPPSLGFSRQEYLSGLPFPSPMHESEKVKVKSLSRVRLLATPWTAAYHAPPSMGFSRQEYWSGVPLPSPIFIWLIPKWGEEYWKKHWLGKFPINLQNTRLLSKSWFGECDFKSRLNWIFLFLWPSRPVDSDFVYPINCTEMGLDSEI